MLLSSLFVRRLTLSFKLFNSGSLARIFVAFWEILAKTLPRSKFAFKNPIGGGAKGITRLIQSYYASAGRYIIVPIEGAVLFMLA